MDLTLIRELSTPDGTFGTIWLDGKELCKTCELPWGDNLPRESCIPVGGYTCIHHDSLHHPNTWELLDVPGRSDILIHNGNTIADSNGCILVGSAFGTVDGNPAVINSNATLDMLRKILPATFILKVTGQYG